MLAFRNDIGETPMNSSNRTKLGIVLAIAVLAALASGLLALLLLAFAAFLIVWGREPKRTEQVIGGLPAGDHLLKALARLDSAIASGSSERRE
jgi:hypothetical protein